MDEDSDVIKKARDVEILKPRILTFHSGSVKQDLRKYLERDEINSLLDRMPAGKNKMLLTFLWMSGVRVSEAVGLLKKGLNFRDRLMTVRWLKSRKYRERVVPIHSRLCPMLELYTQTMKADNRVFPISRIRAYQICMKHLGVSPHCLRHSFAVNWLRCDGDLVLLHRVLGHSKIQTTMEYLKIVPVDQGKELEKVSFH